MPAQLAGEPVTAPAAVPTTPEVAPAAVAAAAAAPTPAPAAPEPIKPEATPDTTEGKFNELLTNPIVLGVIGG
ncbi:hypothetical protein O6461_25445, partial [Salmonella enterica subsp. enterica]